MNGINSKIQDRRKSKKLIPIAATSVLDFVESKAKEMKSNKFLLALRL